MTDFALIHPSTEPSARALETDHSDREDDPTPRGVVRAVLEAAIVDKALAVDGFHMLTIGNVHIMREWDGGRPIVPLRVLDVCAGHGCWASELRRLAVRQGWPVHITGVELFEPRRGDLEKWCDIVHCPQDWAVAREGSSGDSWDLVIGNPHFTALTHEDPEQSMPAVLLRHAPAVLLLHTQQAFARGEAGRRVWRAYPPAASWVVPGSVRFRNGVNPTCPKCGHVNATGVANCEGLRQQGLHTVKCRWKLKPWGTDSRCYQASLWLRDHQGPTALHLLPELAAHERRWTVPPGSEAPSAELPAAPGWSGWSR